MKRLSLFVTVALVLGLVLAGPASAGPPVDGEPDHNGVSNYAIISATQTGASQVTVRVQANYCGACNPNPANQPGCPAFTHGYPPPPPNYWCGGTVPGRYAAVQLSDISGVLGMAKMVCNPTNWPMTVDYQADIVVDTAVPMVAGTIVTVEADIFCSWCGHWYPEPVDIEIEDVIPPVVECIEAENPHGKNIPGGKSSGKGKGINPDGFYQLIATDIGDPNPEIWVGTDCATKLFGPFYNGDIVKITQAPGATPSMKKIGSSNGQAGAVVAHITLPSDALIKAVDAAGLESVCVWCLVPPPPK